MVAAAAPNRIIIGGAGTSWPPVEVEVVEPPELLVELEVDDEVEELELVELDEEVELDDGRIIVIGIETDDHGRHRLEVDVVSPLEEVARQLDVGLEPPVE